CVMLFMTFAMVVAAKREIPSPTHFWWTYAGGAVAIRLFGAQIPDKLGPHNLVVPAMSASLCGLLVLANAYDESALLLAGALGGLGHGMGFPLLTSQIATRASEQARGRAMALFTGLWDLCSLCAPPTMGAVADLYGDATMVTGVGIMALGGLVLWAVTEHQTQS
ncbi:MAG: hypothetical protein CMH53_00155, partial [Myxococcales bacterium]|nr:hypothetical protein [Myxococcales bacterium]